MLSKSKALQNKMLKTKWCFPKCRRTLFVRVPTRTRWRYLHYRRFLDTGRAYTIVIMSTSEVLSIGQEHEMHSQTSQEALNPANSR